LRLSRAAIRQIQGSKKENLIAMVNTQNSHFKIKSVQKNKGFIVVSGFAESPGFKPLDF
jgi:hypothetical protein